MFRAGFKNCWWTNIYGQYSVSVEYVCVCSMRRISGLKVGKYFPETRIAWVAPRDEAILLVVCKSLSLFLAIFFYLYTIQINIRNVLPHFLRLSVELRIPSRKNDTSKVFHFQSTVRTSENLSMSNLESTTLAEELLQRYRRRSSFSPLFPENVVTDRSRRWRFG